MKILRECDRMMFFLKQYVFENFLPTPLNK